MLLDEVDCACPLHLIDGCAFEFSHVRTDFLPAGSVHFSQMSVKVPNYNSAFAISLYLQFFQFLPHVFGHSLVRCIHVKVCYVFLENRPSNHYLISLFFLITVLVLQSTPSDITTATPPIRIVHIFLCFFIFYLNVPLYLK